MNGLFVGAEAKFFSLLLLGFLWIFQGKIPKPRCLKLNFAYLFSFIGIVFSLSEDILATFSNNFYVQTICDVGFGVCYALAGYFWYKYIFEIKKYKETIVFKIVFAFAAIVFGVLAYISAVCRLNVVTYLSVFALLAVLVVDQYNKIRTDSLTKLYNRYGMDEEIKEQLQQYARDKNDLFYIIACDLDNFKYINDTWGHLEGDRALMLISAALLKVGKLFDAEVFRIGGDEFVIIADTSEEEVANDIINAIKTELDSIDFREDFEIKMSMGIALYDGVTHIDDLLNNADKKLYEAKKNGKKD